MTDMVRLYNRHENEKQTLSGVDSAIETNQGVLVEFDHTHRKHGNQRHFIGYRLVGFGR